MARAIAQELRSVMPGCSSLTADPQVRGCRGCCSQVLSRKAAETEPVPIVVLIVIEADAGTPRSPRPIFLSVAEGEVPRILNLHLLHPVDEHRDDHRVCTRQCA